MVREILEKVVNEKLTKPKLIQELEDWLKIVYPHMKATDDKKYKSFKSKKPEGMTSFEFKTGREAYEVMTRVSGMKKFNGLIFHWGANYFSSPWWVQEK